MKDYYKVLGVSRDATQEDIKKVFRQLALKHHPDRNQGEKESEEKFKEINEAYSCLGDPEKRAHYDRYGTTEDLAPAPAQVSADLAQGRPSAISLRTSLMISSVPLADLKRPGRQKARTFVTTLH